MNTPTTMDRLRRLDAKITRCGRCGDWQWDGACSFPHEVADQMEHAA